MARNERGDGGGGRKGGAGIWLMAWWGGRKWNSKDRENESSG